MSATASAPTRHPTIGHLDVDAFTVPTDRPEADGTLAWDETTIVVVRAYAEDLCGVGYTYSDAAAARVVRSTLRPLIDGADALAPQAAWTMMAAALRNIGRTGIAGAALSAVDTALWDLRAQLLELPLCELLGAVRDGVPVYGSGGFTTYTTDELIEQLGGWVADGIGRVKMKIGTDPDADPGRVSAVRQAIGPNAELMVDANGAYTASQALGLAYAFTRSGVTWFEEPVSSDDVAGLCRVRDGAPGGMAIAAGEYGWRLDDLAALLRAGAVDVLQADITRCGGITELLRVDALCAAAHVPLSLHCAPALHQHPGCALTALAHVEYFHDHTRIEELLFDGVTQPVDGVLHPDRSRPGNGLELKLADAQAFAV